MCQECNRVDNKFDLREYLQIKLRNKETLRESAATIVDHCRKIMEPYVQGQVGQAYKEYYKPAMDWIERAYNNGDPKEDFPQALDFMVGSIEWD